MRNTEALNNLIDVLDENYKALTDTLKQQGKIDQKSVDNLLYCFLKIDHVTENNSFEAYHKRIANAIGVIKQSVTKKLKVSFDFDSTLTEIPMQELCKKFIALGVDVYVTTSRLTKVKYGVTFVNKDLFDLTDKLGIPRENITFTEGEDKYLFVKDMSIHFDDDEAQIFLINDYPGMCIGFIYDHNYELENQIAKF